MKMKKRFLGILLSLSLVLGLVPGMGMTAYATTDSALSITSPAVGQVIGNDGKNYDYSSLPQSVIAVAKIAYVDETNHKGLALAMTDESGTKDWNEADTAASAHTPAFTGGTWKLASKDEWDNMITAAGGFASLRDGFSSVEGTNMKGMYWSSTPQNANNEWYININSGQWWSAGKTAKVNVRACLTFDIVTTYPLWVGETQVNSANAGDILGDQTASYVAESNTLTLNGATITKGHRDGDYYCESGIYYNGSELLNIVLADDSVNTVEIAGGPCDSQIGICVDASSETLPRLNISGKGQLTVSGSNYGIHAPIITIDGCDVTASGGSGIHSYRGSIEINGGSVYASATNYAIYAASDMVAYYVIINAGSKVTASGGNKAIFGNVKNVIAGTGWTDTAGTTGEANIAVGEHKRTELTNFKKV